MELVFNIGIGVFLLALFIVTRSFSSGSIDGDVLKAAGFPTLMIIIGIVLLVLVIIHQRRTKTNPSEKLFDVKSPQGKAMATTAGFFFLYLVAMNIVGYIISTVFFSIGAAWAIGYRKYLFLTAFALILTVVFVVLFGKVFYVPLPRGLGFFREFSYYLY